jgi:PIN domain nuclease of toxin-antitoxin system
LYEGRLDLLSAPAKAAIEYGQLFVSPVVDLELQLLKEIGRILKGPADVLGALAGELGLGLTSTEFAEIVASARDLAWTRDPFDRLIVADALISDATLITKDRLIRKHCASSTW